VSVGEPINGRWSIEAQPGEIVTVHYNVRLEHEKHRWPFGLDEIAYVRENSVFMISRTALVINESVRQSRVQFVVPDGWRVAAPWMPVADEPGAFNVGNKGILMQSCVLVGDFTEREVRAGDTVVKLAIGHGLDQYSDTIESAVGAVVPAYRALFEDTPQARFLAVVDVNVAGGITDGSAYPNSVSVLTPRRMEGANFVQAVYTIAHELLHLWNGFRMRPAEQAEWFREGFTDYLTWRTLVDLDLVDETPVLIELKRQLTAYLNLNPTVSIAAAGEDKSENGTLIYEGGSLTALCLDSMIRQRTAGKNGLPEFLRELYARSAKRNIPYDRAMIVAVANEIGDGDFTPFFVRHVDGMEALPLAECFHGIGLRFETKRSGNRVSVTVTPDESAEGVTAATRDAFLGRD
jgi:predicted metalloprotease with PDZ domain